MQVKIGRLASRTNRICSQFENTLWSLVWQLLWAPRQLFPAQALAGLLHIADHIDRQIYTS